MTTWTYRLITQEPVDGDLGALHRKLNAVGADGWEAVGVAFATDPAVFANDTSVHLLTVLLKKPAN